MLGHLLHKAREGVRLRILLDAFGTRMSLDVSGNDYLDTLVGIRNVSLKMYRPLFFRFTDVFLTLNPIALAASDHDKILIVNGRLALTGARNIGKEYFADPADDPMAFRDMDVLLEGKEIGANLTDVFEANFGSAEARAVKPDAVDVVDWGEDLLLAYHAMDAWLRGRPVPEETRAAIRRKGFSWLDDLAKLPRLRGALTGKTAGTIDGRLVLIGTYNIDPFSMAVNGEVVAAVWSEPLARQVRAETQRFISGGPPVVYEYRIARDGQGRPERDGDGKVVVAFGAEAHATPEQWKDVKRYWTLLRIVKKLPGTSRLLWK